jgi:hypothetical protein
MERTLRGKIAKPLSIIANASARIWPHRPPLLIARNPDRVRLGELAGSGVVVAVAHVHAAARVPHAIHQAAPPVALAGRRDFRRVARRRLPPRPHDPQAVRHHGVVALRALPVRQCTRREGAPPVVVRDYARAALGDQQGPVDAARVQVAHAPVLPSRAVREFLVLPVAPVGPQFPQQLVARPDEPRDRAGALPDSRAVAYSVPPRALQMRRLSAFPVLGEQAQPLRPPGSTTCGCRAPAAHAASLIVGIIQQILSPAGGQAQDLCAS